MQVTSERVIVVGAGGFGRETLDVLEAATSATAAWDVIGVVDDQPSEMNLERLAARRVKFLGPADPTSVLDLGASAAIAVGSPSARRVLFERFEMGGVVIATVVHPQANVGSNCVIEVGAIICAGASIGTNVLLRRGCHVNPNATIGHDTVLDDFVSVNPMANVSGECHIGSGTLIGASSVVLQGLNVGDGVTVGAGAVVVRDVPHRSIVKGVPAR